MTVSDRSDNLDKQAFLVSGALSRLVNKGLPALARRSPMAQRLLERLQQFGAEAAGSGIPDDLYARISHATLQRLAPIDQRLGTPLSKAPLIGKLFTRLKLETLPEHLRTATTPAGAVMAHRVPSLSAGAVNAATFAGSMALYDAAAKPKTPPSEDASAMESEWTGYDLPRVTKRAYELVQAQLTKQ